MNSKILFLVSAIAAILYLTGCENPPENPDVINKMSVIGFLRNDSLQQRIMIFKTTSLSDDNAKFISDAKVFLSDSGNYNVRYAYRKVDYGRQYYTNLSTYIFEPGKRYYLEIQTGNGIIKGSTCFPGDFNIESPNNQDSIFFNENKSKDITVTWSKSNDAAGYLVEQQFWEKREVNGTITDSPTGPPYVIVSRDNNCTFTLYKPSYYNYPGSKVLSSRCEIRVTAFDKNYYDHHFDLYSSAGVTGAYGYFASGVVKTITLNIR